MPTSVLIDNARDRPGHAALYEAPREIIRADTPGEVDGALAALETARQSGAHLAGYFSYELGYALEPRFAQMMPGGRRVPLLWFGAFDQPRALEGREVEDYLNASASGGYRLSEPELTMSAKSYGTRFARVKNYIAAGDIYQLNLTLKGRFRVEGDPVALYRDLRRKQPVSYGALLRTDDFTVISASPELFLRIEGDRVVTRPMKGTAARGLTLDQDSEIGRWLARDLKSRAENLMIVDLMRNDLGRVAQTGSVRVSDLFTIETYETLHQMTSGVEARLNPGMDIATLLANIFPPGSVTGAPKVRAMEIIRELETEPRGVYTGSLGAISPDGAAQFNVAIRTLTLFPGGEAEIGIGSGVVQDSRSREEYDECLLKMKFLTNPVRDFQLIETFAYDRRDGYVLLARHLDRLKGSAQYFRIPFTRGKALAALEKNAASLGDGRYRVRLLLFKDGRIEITNSALPASGETSEMVYVISEQTIDSGDAFLYHKTTERDLYDGEWARMNEKFGSDEVVFLNQRGEVAEGSRTNVFARIGSKLLTPPVASGLLPGTFRAEMLARGDAEEGVLTPECLARAETVYLGNSVRGLVPAREMQTPAERSAIS